MVLRGSVKKSSCGAESALRVGQCRRAGRLNLRTSRVRIPFRIRRAFGAYPLRAASAALRPLTVREIEVGCGPARHPCSGLAWTWTGTPPGAGDFQQARRRRTAGAARRMPRRNRQRPARPATRRRVAYSGLRTRILSRSLHPRRSAQKRPRDPARASRAVASGGSARRPVPSDPALATRQCPLVGQP